MISAFKICICPVRTPPESRLVREQQFHFKGGERSFGTCVHFDAELFLTPSRNSTLKQEHFHEILLFKRKGILKQISFFYLQAFIKQ